MYIVDRRITFNTIETLPNSVIETRAFHRINELYSNGTILTSIQFY